MTSNDRVLEIGCGVARIGQRIASMCREWVGADVSVNMLRHAKAACAAASVTNVDFFHLNGSDLTGIPDASFDVVYCTAVFMHLEEWDRYRYVREAYRVLKPGGRIYFDNVSLISDEGWRQFDALVRYDPAARPPNISKASTPEELRTYATRAGFTDINVRPAEVFITVTGKKPALIEPQVRPQAKHWRVSLSSWPAPVSLWVLRLKGWTTAAPSLAVGAVSVTRPRRKRSSKNAVTAFVGLGATTEPSVGAAAATAKRFWPVGAWTTSVRLPSPKRWPSIDMSATVTAESAASRLAAAFRAGIVAISVFMLSVDSSDNTP